MSGPDAAAWASTALLLVLTPVGRDASVASAVLARAGFRPRSCADMAALCAALADGAADGVAPNDAAPHDAAPHDAAPHDAAPHEPVGALVVAEEVLAGAERGMLLDALAAQPAWSDVPVVVLTREGALTRALSPALEALAGAANVTLLERPVRVATLVSAIRSALRARRRQFDVRDHLAARAASEVALRAARAQAEAANRAKSEFLAVMSHELRTPLNAIGGYTELLELGLHGPVTDAQRTALARIQASQRHLLGLIAGVLDYSRVEAGAVTYRLEDVPVAEAVAEAEVLVAPQLRAKGLAYVWSGAPAELRVRADREKLQQILLNLLGNAVKFTDLRDEGPGTIEVSCTSACAGAGGGAEAGPESEAGSGVRAGVGQVALHIRDTGRGIAPEKLASVFEPFVQADQRLTRPQEGVGLGLAISRDLARGMGGDLTARSTLGVGSTFTLTLPCAEGPAA